MGGKPRTPPLTVREIPCSAWTLLPPPAGACLVCGRPHEPSMPHDAQSLYWQTKRRIEGLPPATWDDALAHVSDEMHSFWRTELGKYGIAVALRVSP